MIHRYIFRKECLTISLAFALLPVAMETIAAEVTIPVKNWQLAVNDDLSLEETAPPCRIPTTAEKGRAALGEVGIDQPGRYRIRLHLAAPPFANTNAQLRCILSIPGETPRERTLSGTDLPQDQAPLIVAWEIVLTEPAPANVAVHWSGNTLPAMSAPVAPAQDTTLMDTDATADTAAKQPAADWSLPYVRLIGADVTRLDGGLGLVRVFPNKLRYEPGEAGTVAVTVRNFTDAEQTAELRLTLVQELDRERAVAPVPVTVPAGAEHAVELPFNAGDRQFGCEARVTLTQGDMIFDRRIDYFAVSDNVWKVGLGAHQIRIMSMSGWCQPVHLEMDLRKLRETYTNWWEKFFWPPDDWGDMTPQREEWISGQSARWEKAEHIEAFVKMAKANGITSITYGKHVTMGPEGAELVRRNPEWFLRAANGRHLGGFNTWDVAHWHDIELHMDPEGRKRFSSDTCGGVFPDFREKAPLEWGIKELIESSKRFGWDGVRFDGHWTAGNDELSAANMRRLKEALWEYDSNYLFGFNQSWSYGHQTSSTPAGMVSGYDHELREAMAGGGLYMQEAIGGNFQYGMSANERYTSWKNYAVTEAQNTQGVHVLGGTYHFIYGTWNMSATPKLHKFVLGTAAGIHPVYGDHMNMPGCPNWGRFLTRWSAFVWDPDMTILPPDGIVDVTSTNPVWWKEWTRERIADATTRHVVIHLINPPVDDTIDSQRQDSLPAPVENIVVRLQIPENQTPGIARWLDPLTETARPLPTQTEDGWLSMTVPRLDVWGMAVVEFSGDFTVPAPRARFSELPDPAKVAEGRQAGGSPTSMDPTRPDDTAQHENRWIFETDSSYNSCPGRGIADPDALNGVAQVRERGEKGAAIGRSWLGPLPAGRYEAHLRVKAEGDGPQWLRMRLLIHGGGRDGGSFDKNYDFATADLGRTDKAHTLIQDGDYHDYVIPFECPKDGLAPSFLGSGGTQAPDESRLLMDRIAIVLLERYTDRRQAELNPMQVPENITPGGKPGLDILVVKGRTWKTYRLEEALQQIAGNDRVSELWSSRGEAIEFPQAYELLFNNDVVVLCNVGAYGLQYAGRKILKDFVEAGGSLVILGGMDTLGQGNIAGTYLADLLPVDVRDTRDVERAPKPLTLKPGTGTFGTEMADALAKDSPVLYWRHRVTPKPDATVELLAGDEPVLLSWQVGKGRVTLFTGTALGRQLETETPFWEWQHWPELLAKTITHTVKE